MRIAIVGSGCLSVKMLLPLLDSKHEVVAVILDGRHTRGIRRWLEPRLARWFRGEYSLGGQAIKYDLPIYYIDKMTEEEVAPLKALKLDLIVVGGFSIILKKPLLDVPRLGCVNTHSSLLPRHRGPNPFSAAILAGDAETGVTFHWMDEDIDTGDIIVQHKIALNEESTMLGLYRDACELAGKKVEALVNSLEVGDGLRRPQSTEAATYEKRFQVADSWIDWTDTAENIERLVRGMSPQPYVRFQWRKHVILVHKVTFDPRPVTAAPGTVLVNRPVVKIATGSGVIILRVAFRQKPVPWIWPAFGSRPDVEEVLPSGAPGAP